MHFLNNVGTHALAEGAGPKRSLLRSLRHEQVSAGGSYQLAAYLEAF
jgi:hypothetical protein